MIFSKHKYPLPYCREHYFHDTRAITSLMHFVVLTILKYSRSLLRIKIDFSEQNQVQELLTISVTESPDLSIERHKQKRTYQLKGGTNRRCNRMYLINDQNNTVENNICVLQRRYFTRTIHLEYMTYLNIYGLEQPNDRTNENRKYYHCSFCCHG